MSEGPSPNRSRCLSLRRTEAEPFPQPEAVAVAETTARSAPPAPEPGSVTEEVPEPVAAAPGDRSEAADARPNSYRPRCGSASRSSVRRHRRRRCRPNRGPGSSHVRRPGLSGRLLRRLPRHVRQLPPRQPATPGVRPPAPPGARPPAAARPAYPRADAATDAWRTASSAVAAYPDPDTGDAATTGSVPAAAADASTDAAWRAAAACGGTTGGAASRRCRLRLPRRHRSPGPSRSPRA